MVIVASVSILYNTSSIIHNYQTDQHVAAALSLFGSIAMLFWYVLRIFLSRE
jgi:FtsH-binding integral membrane protein